MSKYSIGCFNGVWYVYEEGSNVPVAGPYLNKYIALTERDGLNGEVL